MSSERAELSMHMFFFLSFPPTPNSPIRPWLLTVAVAAQHQCSSTLPFLSTAALDGLACQMWSTTGPARVRRCWLKALHCDSVRRTASRLVSMWSWPWPTATLARDVTETPTLSIVRGNYAVCPLLFLYLVPEMPSFCYNWISIFFFRDLKKISCEIAPDFSRLIS